MPTVHVENNLNDLINTLQTIRAQTKNAVEEAFRIEGMIRVFKNLHDVGVVEIPIPDSAIEKLQQAPTTEAEAEAEADEHEAVIDNSEAN
jgi:hypothetical protein